MNEARREEITARLTTIRDKRAEIRRLQRESAQGAATWVPVAVEEGMPILEIAHLVGLSRSAIYTILNPAKHPPNRYRRT